MAKVKSPFTPYQIFVVALMAFLQFTVILDFMIMSPLGAILMPTLKISPAQFGVVVSGYAFSAGISGLLAAGFADRFDRKNLLLFFYVGFILGTLFCALAPNFELLLAARIITGLFGGVIGSVVLAITTDLFSFQQRGRVMGFVQTAFAASQVLGIPLGLYVSNLWGWHAPFLLIVAVSVLALVAITMYLRPINAHLGKRTDKNAFHHLWATITTPRFQLAFATMGLLSLGGFMLMPFGSAFTVNNLGVEMGKLPLIYLLTGFCAIITGPAVGRLSDSFGKLRTFMVGAIISIVMVVIYTNLGVTPWLMVVLVTALMFVGIFSRLIPAQALMSAMPEPENRGAFMAVSSSTQQLAGGIASVVAGLIVVETPTGLLDHFDVLGYILVGTVIATMVMMVYVNRIVLSARGAN